MAGEEDLNQLLASMQPSLLPEDYVFCTVAGSDYGDLAELQPIASFQEAEGLTLVLPKQKAVEADLAFESVFSCITLMVHSSLDAVGLTAAVSGRLATNGISANVIAAYYHDHVFVPKEKAERALELLSNF